MTSAIMMEYQLREIIGQLSLLQLHDEATGCPCTFSGGHDIQEWCIPKHLLTLSYLLSESGSMSDDKTLVKIMMDIQSDADAYHEKAKKGVVCKVGDFPQGIAKWAREARKKLEKYYYSCKVTLHQDADLAAQSYTYLVKKLDKCNLESKEAEQALGYKPLRDLIALPVGIGAKVELCRAGFVPGTYQVSFQLDPKHPEYFPTNQRIKTIVSAHERNFKRVYDPNTLKFVYNVTIPEFTCTIQDLIGKGQLTPELVVRGEKGEQAKMFSGCRLLKLHDDGDKTLKCGKLLYIETTDGKRFKEMKDKAELEGNMTLNLKARDIPELIHTLESSGEIALANRIREIAERGKGIEYIPADLPSQDWQIIKKTGFFQWQYRDPRSCNKANLSCTPCAALLAKGKPKLERCILDVKAKLPSECFIGKKLAPAKSGTKTCPNPFAVCRASVK